MEINLLRVAGSRKNNITFVEVMLSTAVLAILAAILIPFFNRANQKGLYANWKTYKSKLQLDPALTCYYDFSDGKGNILTNSSRNTSSEEYDAIDLDGRILNAAGWKKGRWQLKWGVKFNGESSHILSNGDFSGTSASVICWFKSSDMDSGILSFTERRDLDSVSKRHIYMKGGYVISATPKGAIKSNTKCDDGEWHMLAVTMGKKQGKHILYIDGKAESESDSFEVGGDAIKSIIIGYCSNAPFYDGLIDEVIVFKRELLADEIAEAYKAGKP